MKLEELTAEQQEKISEFGVNTWYVLELLGQYKSDPDSVSDKWKELFKDLKLNSKNGNQTAYKSDTQTESKNNSPVSNLIMPPPGEGEEAQVIRGVSAKIIENMNSSLTVPTEINLRKPQYYK